MVMANKKQTGQNYRKGIKIINKNKTENNKNPLGKSTD
jgi:hypothetical protein